MAFVLHNDGETLRERGDVGCAAAARQSHFWMRMLPVTDHGGVEIAVAINFRAADEAELHVSCRHRAHDVEGSGCPERTVNIGRITHCIEQFRRWRVAYHAAL